MTAPVTPDGRYIVVDGRLWRASDPRLPADVRQELVDALMDARRAVKAALKAGDGGALRSARLRVQAAKEGLGERGEPWWDDGAEDFNAAGRSHALCFMVAAAAARRRGRS